MHTCILSFANKKIIIHLHNSCIYNLISIINLLLALYYLLLSLKFIFLDLCQGKRAQSVYPARSAAAGGSPARDLRVICENLGMRPRIRTEICPHSDLSFAAKWGQLETRTSAGSLPHSAEIYSVGLIEADRSDDVTDRQRGAMTLPQGELLSSLR